MDAWKRDLHERLGQLSPSLIVALGGLALEALTVGLGHLSPPAVTLLLA